MKGSTREARFYTNKALRTLPSDFSAAPRQTKSDCGFWNRRLQ